MSTAHPSTPPPRTSSRRPSLAQVQVESPTSMSPIGTPPAPARSQAGSLSSVTTAPSAAPFPSRTTSRPQIKRAPTYDYSIPTPPQEFTDTFSSEPGQISPPSNVGASGSGSHQPPPSASKPAWDAIRRKVLPTATGKAATVASKVWPVLNPANHAELVLPSSERDTPTHGGRSTPTAGGFPAYSNGRATPVTKRTLDYEGGTYGLARLVGAAGKVGARRKGKRRAEPSVAQRFALELNQVDALFRGSSESCTKGEGLALAAQGIPNNGVSSVGAAGGGRRRAGSDALKLQQEAAHQADPVQALRLLETILDRYRPTGSVPDQNAVLSLLARPFVYPSRRGGQVDKFEEAVADLALAAFDRFAGTFAPGDAEEEGERWRWLLKAMEVRSDDLRTRIGRLVRQMINPRLFPSHWSHLISSVTLHSLLAALVNLLHHLALYPTESTSTLHARGIKDLIEQLSSGELFAPSAAHFALSLNLPAATFDTLSRERLSQLILFDGLLLIAVGGTPQLTEWILAGGGSELIVRYWLEEGVGALMRARLLSLFARACHRLLSSPLASASTTRPASSGDIFAPSAEAHDHLDALKPALLRTLATFYPISAVNELSPTIRGRLVYAHLAFFSSLSSTAYQLREWPPPIAHTGMTREAHEAKLWVGQAWKVDRAGAQEAVRSAVRELGSLEAVAGVVGACTMGMRDEAANDSFASAVLGTLFERVTSEPAAGQCAPLLALLRLLATRHPQTFFKPLFTLASSQSPAAVRTALSTVLTLSHLLGSAVYLLRDPEMMAVALLADPTQGKEAAAQQMEKTSSTFDEAGWAPIRLGQLALLLEMGLVLKSIRTDPATPKLEWESAVRFAEGFESRFAVFLAQRERTSVLPFSQRVLVAGLLFELRMLAKPSSRPIWLNRIITWARSSRIDRTAHFELRKTVSTSLTKDGSSSLPSYYAPEGAQVTGRVVSEPVQSFGSLQMLYEDAHKLLTDPDSFKRRSAAARASVLSPASRPKAGPKEELSKRLAKRLEDRTKALRELKWDPLQPVFVLLVAVHSVLAEPELVKLLEVAWEALDAREGEKGLVAPAAYLIGLCMEKTPDLLAAQLAADSSAHEPTTRATLVRKLSAFFAQRHALVLQPSADPKRRKAFKVARQQLSFVPLEVGSSDYVPTEPLEDSSAPKTGSLPPEVRRALTELGWDDRTEEQTVTERQRRPLSLLPWNEAAVAEGAQGLDAPASPSKSPQRLSLHRGNSASSLGKMGGYLGSGKARPIVTLAMARNLLRLTELLGDADVIVASTAKSALLGFLRDEPILLLAPVLLELSGSVADQKRAISHVRLLLSLQTSLPPGVTYRLFNHLGGLLKTVSREKDAQKTLLPLMSSVLPSAAALAPLVSDFSLRDLRKNKVEPLFLSPGSFWFANDHPTNMALPSHKPTEDRNPFSTLGVDSTTFRVALVRVAQSNLQGSYVGKVPREAYAIKKSWSELQLPFAAAENPLDFSALRGEGGSAQALSALVARAWLLALMPVIGGLSRNFNVRQELAVVFSGVSSILLAHGGDTNLVGLALRLCMSASTRFRRLFASSNGFGLFMPALFNVFVRAREGNAAIRASILYACQRFYRAHEESFVFQALGALSPTFDTPQLGPDGLDARPLLAGDLFAMIETLQMPEIDVADIAGIRGENEREEREALIHQAYDRPDVFLASFGTKEGEEKSKKEEKRENARLASAIGQGKPFSTESAIKLFLTVVAFDPTSGRAREFLNVFHHLVPSFYAASPAAAALLAEGIAALANVFAKPGGKRALLRTEGLSSSPAKGRGDEDEKADSSAEGVTWLLMRRSYLQLVEAFHFAGGEISPQGMKRVLEIVRATMREPNVASIKASASTLTTYTLSVLGPKAHPDKAGVLSFLNEMAPLVRMYLGLVDFSTLFDALARVRTETGLKDDAQLAELVTRRMLGPALEGCAAAGPSAGGGGRFMSSHAAAVRLFAIWTTHPLTDALAELERQPATAVFLSSFVFPLALQLANPPRMGGHAQREMDSTDGRERRRLAWMRVVGYAIRATCPPISGGIVGNAERKEREGRRWAARKTFAVLVVKVALIAAEEELERTPGAWLKLASFFRELLATAGSSFLKEYDPNPPQSAFPGLSNPWAPASHHAPPIAPPPEVELSVSLLDSAAWSLFALLTAYPSPLAFHLRLFIREKLVGARLSSGAGRPPRKESLASLERRRGSSIFALPLLGGGSRNGSASSSALGVMGLPLRSGRERSPSAEGNLSLPGSPDPDMLGGRRRSSATSGRRRSSAGTPFQPTLEVFARDFLPIAVVEPALGPSASVGAGATLGRRGSTVPGGLGPISAPRPLNMSSSSGGGGVPGQVPTLASTREKAAGWARATLLSQELAKEVVRHVRGVQVVMGESPIPLPDTEPEHGGEEEGEGEYGKSLTRAEALRRVREEMLALVGEFGDVWEGQSLGAGVGREEE